MASQPDYLNNYFSDGYSNIRNTSTEWSVQSTSINEWNSHCSQRPNCLATEVTENTEGQ